MWENNHFQFLARRLSRSCATVFPSVAPPTLLLLPSGPPVLWAREGASFDGMENSDRETKQTERKERHQGSGLLSALLCFRKRSWCSPGWSWTSYVAKDGFLLLVIYFPTYRVLVLLACATIAGFMLFWGSEPKDSWRLGKQFTNWATHPHTTHFLKYLFLWIFLCVCVCWSDNVYFLWFISLWFRTVS